MPPVMPTAPRRWGAAAIARRLAPSLLAVVVVAATTGRLAAQVLGDSTTRINTTVAYQDGLFNWDAMKELGGERVIEHNRAEWEPIGMPAGNFLFLPEASLDLTFASDISNDGDQAKGDLFATSRARIIMQSQLPRHVLDVSIDASFVTYLENTDQNYEDLRASVAGRVDIDAGNAVFAEARSNYTHDPRFNVDSPASAAEPIPAWTNYLEAGYVRDYGRLRLLVGAFGKSVDYSDVNADDGSTIDQDYRDQTSFGGYLRLHYRVSPGYSVFGAIGSERTEFWDDASSIGANWKSTVKSGVEWELDRLVRASFAAGYTLKDYDSPLKTNLGSMVWDARIDWLARPELNFNLEGGQKLEETTYSAASARLTTSAGISAEYELLRNVILSARAGVEQSEFLSTDREDLAWSARLGAQYLVNKNLKFTFEYEYLQRDSNIDEFDGDNYRASVGVRWSF